jgi:hypothetical protein
VNFLIDFVLGIAKVREQQERRCMTCGRIALAKNLIVRIELRPTGPSVMATWHCQDRDGCVERAAAVLR